MDDNIVHMCTSPNIKFPTLSRQPYISQNFPTVSSSPWKIPVPFIVTPLHCIIFSFLTLITCMFVWILKFNEYVILIRIRPNLTKNFQIRASIVILYEFHQHLQIPHQSPDDGPSGPNHASGIIKTVCVCFYLQETGSNTTRKTSKWATLNW
jgi:hypothetical protein